MAQIDDIYEWTRVRTPGANLNDVILDVEGNVNSRVTKAESDLKLFIEEKFSQLENRLTETLTPVIKQACKDVLAEAPILQGLDSDQIADKLWERLEQQRLDG